VLRMNFLLHGSEQEVEEEGKALENLRVAARLVVPSQNVTPLLARKPNHDPADAINYLAAGDLQDTQLPFRRISLQKTPDSVRPPSVPAYRHTRMHRRPRRIGRPQTHRVCPRRVRAKGQKKQVAGVVASSATNTGLHRKTYRRNTDASFDWPSLLFSASSRGMLRCAALLCSQTNTQGGTVEAPLDTARPKLSLQSDQLFRDGHQHSRTPLVAGPS
jgi:hypothetical protein